MARMGPGLGTQIPEVGTGNPSGRKMGLPIGGRREVVGLGYWIYKSRDSSKDGNWAPVIMHKKGTGWGTGLLVGAGLRILPG